MKVLYLCWLDAATTDYPLFIKRQWEAAGHTVDILPYDLEQVTRADEDLRGALSRRHLMLEHRVLETRVDRRCGDLRPDLLLLGSDLLPPAALDRLRRRHGMALGFFLGYNHLLAGETAGILRMCDLALVHDSYLIPILRDHGSARARHVLFMPCTAHAQEHCPVDLSAFDRERYGCDVAFIGGAGAHRRNLLRRLQGHHLRIWGGPAWEQDAAFQDAYSNEPVYGHKKTKIYNAAKIVLNIEDADKQINAISNRVPEVLACGGFVITEWRKDLEDLPLVEGESVVSFRTADEMVEKVDYYLARPDERARIARAGRQIVLEKLTNNLAPVADAIAAALGLPEGRRS